jgi:hypothetical protein
MVEANGHGPIHPARTVRQRGLGLVGNLGYGFAPGLVRRVLRTVVCPGVAFPVVGCYNRYRSIPLARELGSKAGCELFQG